MRSPTATSRAPSASLSSAMSMVASPLPPTSTKATSAPMPTMVPSIVWPCAIRFVRCDAANSAAKSSVDSLMPRSYRRPVPGAGKMRRMRRGVTLIALTLVIIVATGVIAQPRASAAGRVQWAPTPIQRALGFLLLNQVQRPIDVTVDGQRTRDFPGDWPQYFRLQGGASSGRVRDVSPFTVAFIHHALTSIVEPNRQSLNLGDLDLIAAGAMRQRALGFMRLFQSLPAAPDAGTFGFWPYDIDPARPDLLTTLLLTAWLKGPILGGSRVPINLPIYPTPLAIPTDADVTSTTYAAMIDAALLD